MIWSQRLSVDKGRRGELEIYVLKYEKVLLARRQNWVLHFPFYTLYSV